MRALPDLDDVEVMAKRGRVSALASARNEACELLRDSVTRIQSADLFRDDVSEHLKNGRAAMDRIEQVQQMLRGLP